MSNQIEYKETNLLWCPLIPKDWEVKKLKYVVDFLDSKRVPLSSDERGKMINRVYDYYGASGIIDKVENYIFDGTYILLGEDGANLITRSTELAFIATGRFWVNNHAHILEPREGNIYYFKNLLESYDYYPLISGSAQPKLTSENLANIDLPIPPIEVQHKIANFLDQKTTEIDNLISQKQKLIDCLKEERMSIINQAVTKGINPNVEMKDSGIKWLGDIPKHWDRLCLKRLVSIKITDGPHETPIFTTDGVPFVSAEAIKEGTIDFNAVRGYISEELDLKYSLKCKPKRNDLFIVKSGSTTGKIALVNSDINFNIWSPIALVRTNHLVNYKFLYYALSSYYFQTQIQTFWSFGTQPNIGMNVLENLIIKLPSIEEQIIIVNELDIKINHIEKLIAKIEQEIDLIKEYRTSLINEVVTGKKIIK